MASYAPLNLLVGKEILTKDGPSTITESFFEGKIIGLYFSAHWCGPCRNFTPKLKEKYNEITAAGKKFEIIFISGDNDEDSAVSYYGEMPWTMLNFKESSTNSALSDFFEISGIPALVLFSSDGTITLQGREAIMTTPFDEIRNFEALKRAAAAKAAEELQALRGSFNPIDFFSGYLNDKDGNSVPTTTLENKIIGLYFSAHWCPPCRGFTPLLAEKYNKLLSEGKEIEIIFISSDRDESSALTYFSGMPWKMFAFSEREKKASLSKLFDVRGIPTLVLMQSNGKVITTEGREAIMSVEFDKLRNFE